MLAQFTIFGELILYISALPEVCGCTVAVHLLRQADTACDFWDQTLSHELSGWSEGAEGCVVRLIVWKVFIHLHKQRPHLNIIQLSVIITLKGLSTFSKFLSVDFTNYGTCRIVLYASFMWKCVIMRIITIILSQFDLEMVTSFARKISNPLS